MPEWFILAAIGGLLSNGFSIFTRYFLKEDQDNFIAWTWFFEAFRLVIFAIIAVFDFSFHASPKTFILLFLIGLTEAGAVYYFMKMHAYSHLSISSIISRTRMIWIPILAVFLLGEHLRLIEYVGILVLFLGVSITSSPHKLFIDKGARYANIAAIIIALNTVLIKMALPDISVSVLLTASTVPSVLIFPFLLKHPKKELIQSIKRKTFLKISAIMLSIVSFYLLVVALKTGDVSVANALYQGMLFTSVIVGIIFFRERSDIGKKIIGAAVTIVGILLLT